MPEITVQGQTIAVSEAGWLENTADWNDEVAKVIAEAEDVVLTDAHWDAIRVAREYYDENGIVAEQRIFMRLMKEKFGPERASQQYLYTLFPHGPLKQGNKIAGLPRPRGCS